MQQTWKAKNPEKVKGYTEKWRAANPERVKAKERAAGYRRNYGITIEEFDSMLASQDGTCAICYAEPRPGKRNFHVDHDHETGKVRGILCHNCNTAVGLLDENLERLSAATSYLRKFGALARNMPE
jgi:hypothetical protein